MDLGSKDMLKKGMEGNGGGNGGGSGGTSGGDQKAMMRAVFSSDDMISPGPSIRRRRNIEYS